MNWLNSWPVKIIGQSLCLRLNPDVALNDRPLVLMIGFVSKLIFLTHEHYEQKWSLLRCWASGTASCCFFLWTIKGQQSTSLCFGSKLIFLTYEHYEQKWSLFRCWASGTAVAFSICVFPLAAVEWFNWHLLESSCSKVSAQMPRFSHKNRTVLRATCDVF